ncbi:hypothetical protein [Reichenbachiella versicolor]|uniref:hypothetical protein n=1 Tax=Reichenbachiella versicolor TaxID=1821036 RepID=UPI000D6DF360|nr:hypothetical protein [Reichenbachiella versicolor]
MESNVLVVSGILSLYESIDDKIGFTGFLLEGTKVSVWIDDSNFTAARIQELNNEEKVIYKGHYSNAVIAVWNTKVALEMSVGSKIKIGVPFSAVGEFTVDKVILRPQKGVFED